MLAACLAGPAISAELRILVIDPDKGQPVAAVSLTVKRIRPPAEWRLTCDEQGKAGIPEAAPGDYWISVEKAGYRDPTDPGGLGRTFEFKPDQPLPQVLVLRRTAAMSGRVLREDGRPMAGLGVWALPMAPADKAPAGTLEEPGAVTDDQGAYRLHGLLPGNYFIAVFLREQALTEQASGIVYFPDSTGPYHARAVGLSPGAELTSIDVRFPKWRAATVSGTISGLPDAWNGRRALIGLIPHDGLRLPVATTATGPDGRFRLSGAPPGKYQLVAFGPDAGSGFDSPPDDADARFAGAAVQLQDGEDLVQDLTLTPGFPIDVTTSGAASCAGAAKLQILPLVNWPEWWRFSQREGEGRTTWENVPPGAYLFDLPDLDTACTFTGLQTVQGGKLPASIIIKSAMTLAARISASNGTVTGSVVRNQEPAPGSPIALWYAGGRPFGRQTATDPQGSFRFEKLPAGEYWITALPPEGVSPVRPVALVLRQFRLAPGQSIPVEITLRGDK
ncbi:hypothetical protein [Paludibaculum fermentans]|uniref:hypothetical protein n=1 Tax=Paludibaculum fermentans TaxID=1473598 RepID=UPI003EBF0095